MDSGEVPVESIIVSVPSSPGSKDGGVEVEKDPVTPSPIRKAWDCFMENCLDYDCISTLFFAFLILIFSPLIPLYVLGWVPKKWKRVFILSCVAVCIDSLFLYIPIIDKENKCLGSDKRLRNVALVLRSVTDVAFIFHIIRLIKDKMEDDPKWDDSKGPVARSWLSFNVIVNFLTILPIPQVAITVGLYNLGGSKHFMKQTVINVSLIFQYILRILQIFLSIKKVGDTVGKFIKGSFYFLLYIIASHVLAAFWYFFSIQRVISCWDNACQAIEKCMSVYECGRSSVNSTSINQLCPIDSPDATLFNFGMFLDILQSGNASSKQFSTKFFYSFWWGLKNLSNFGTNLETSSYIWENCFAIIICVIGLLLFLFLIGNVQTYIQSESEKFVNIRDSRRMRINTKYGDIEKWMSSHELPDDIKTYTMQNIKEYSVVKRIDEDVGACFLEKCYSKQDNKLDPLDFICVKALKRIPILRRLNEQDLKVFCKETLPSSSDKDALLARAGEELFYVYMIIDGVVECKDPETMNTHTMRRYDCVGVEVLRWALLNYKKQRKDHESLPISTVDIKCQIDVEEFMFSPYELIEIFEKLNNIELARQASNSSADQRIVEWLLRNEFPEDLKVKIMNLIDQNNLIVEENMYADVDVAFLFSILPRDFEASIKHHLGITALKKVPMLQTIHEYVLESICSFLQPIVYKKDEYILRAGDHLNIMILILRGTIILSDMTSSNTATTISAETSDVSVIEIHSYYGEQLLRCASPNIISSAENHIIASRDVKCQTKVEALILKADDLRSVATKCGSQWNLITNIKSQHFVGNVRDTMVDTGNEDTSIQLHQGHDMLLEQLLLIRETMLALVGKVDDQGGRLNEMAAFLAGLGYASTPSATSPP